MIPSPSAQVSALGGGDLQLLLCRAGATVCALPLPHVVETLRPLPIEALPGMPLFLAGFAVIRGGPVPVVSLACLLGEQEPTQVARFVVTRVQERRVALAVEAVLGVRPIRTATLGELPLLMREARADFVAAIGTLDARLLVVLESARIITESTWMLLRAGGGST